MTNAETRRVWAKLKRWREHPITMAREEFGFEPDAWQAEVLEAFPKNNRIVMKACKGPGKTAVLAILAWNFLATRPHPRIAATSITGDNLFSALWPEMAKWQTRSPFLMETFTWSKTAIAHNFHPATWWMQARTWPKKADAQQQADALGGLHEDFAMWVCDEMGGYPQALMATIEAVLASGIETKVIGAGNPTHTTGPLYRACTTDKALWYVVTITADPNDPKRTPRVSLKHAQEQIKQYGRENPWVKVNILGEFPAASINALLGAEEVNEAMRRHLTSDVYEWSQKRLGVDVARFGDDRTVIFPRQGLAAFRPVVLRNMRTTDIAARVMKAKLSWGSELELIDDTFQWGKGVIDNLITGGVPAIGVNYAGKAIDPRYNSKRCEGWFAMSEWVKAGGALPQNDDLVAELCEPTYTYLGGKFVMEPKEQIKERLGRSPDLADALMCTFAMPDMPGELTERIRGRHTTLHDGDPIIHGRGHEETGVGHTSHDGDPLL